VLRDEAVEAVESSVIATKEMSSRESYGDFLKAFVYKEDEKAKPWLRGIRRKAFDRFTALGLPTKKLENWKRTNFESILKTPFHPESRNLLDFRDLRDSDFSEWVETDAWRLVLLNGIYSARFSNGENLPSGVVARDLASAILEDPKGVQISLCRNPENESNPFAHLNTLSFQDGVYLYVPPGVRMERPVHLVLAGLGGKESPVVFYPRILVLLGEDAKADFVFHHISLNQGRYLMNGVAEIYVGKGAKMHWTVVQQLGMEASQFLTSKCHLAESSSLESVFFARGGDVTHNELEIIFEGENASSRLNGLSLLSGRSRVSEIVTARYAASHCVGRQVYKNIVADEAQAEFNSLVHVCSGTEGSNSDQQNRNLILSESARAHSRPQLKIDADDVQATHGSATGQLEEKELFYLQSRGLTKELARFVLTYGFAKEILEKIRPDALRQKLEDFVRQELEAMVGYRG